MAGGVCRAGRGPRAARAASPPHRRVWPVLPRGPPLPAQAGRRTPLAGEVAAGRARGRGVARAASPSALPCGDDGACGSP